MRLILILLLPLMVWASSDRAIQLQKMKSEKRLALVIGNSDYSTFSKLKNPLNDARSIKDALKKRGFEVIYLTNSDKRTMVKAIHRFGKRLRYSSIGLFFYAGHAIEVDGKNYLIPIGSKIEDKSDAEFEAVEANRVLAKMDDAGNRLNIVILDACRNDPFSRGSKGGLAAINDAKGVFVAYATAPGKTAADGKGKHGLFTQHLLKQMNIPGNNLRDLFHNVRADVSGATDGKQWPFVSDGTVGDFFFTLPDSSDTNVAKLDVDKVGYDTYEDKYFSLRIDTTPYNSKVTILNSNKAYYEGIKLKPGSYDVRVSKEGYIDKTITVHIQKNSTFYVKLTQKQKKAKVLLDESFNDNINRWVEKEDKDSYLKVRNGVYRFKHFKKSGSWSIWKRIYGVSSGDDFTFEGTLQHHSGIDNYGIALRWGTTSNTNYYAFAMTPNGYYQLGHIVNNIWTSEIKWTKNSNIRQGNRSNDLKIIKKNGRARFYINGTFVDEAPVENFRELNVGVLLDRNHDVSIHRLKVTKN